MTEKRKNLWTWIARVVVLLTLLAGALHTAKQLPAAVHEYAALAAAMLGIGSAWIYSFLPSKTQDAEPKP